MRKTVNVGAGPRRGRFEKSVRMNSPLDQSRQVVHVVLGHGAGKVLRVLAGKLRPVSPNT